jgi:transcriptional regulator with XRE-family HTH domain
VNDNPRLQLARRLRALREESWPGRKITQPQLAKALGVSVPSVSSWESLTNPKMPPLGRLDAYAALFATTRSFDEARGRIIPPQDMSDDERQLMDELKQELRQGRNAVMKLGAGAAASEPDPFNGMDESLSSGPWRFRDGTDITLVCPQWPADMMQKIPYTNIDEADYIELLTYSELDTLFELYGHIRAANPANQVNLRSADKLTSDDYTSHLVTLGGIDWNEVTRSAAEKLDLPVRQVADWNTEGGQYFETEGAGDSAQYRPILDNSSDPPGLVEDVALFARGVNPFNQKRTITICSGMYGRGTYGAVRALTDKRFRDRNAQYLKSRFANNDAYCILTRVPIVMGQTLTPDWTDGTYTLFEWPGRDRDG